MKHTTSTLAAMAILVATGTASNTAFAARDYISIVGSSTVYPFATVVAERFGKTARFKTPKVESTGSGGGLKLFCQGVGVNIPDITNASRRIKQSEIDTCAKNGVKEIVELKIGYDGIVLANSKQAPRFHMTLRDVYLGLAKEIPDPKAPASGQLVANPYKTWKEVNAQLPDEPIQVYGPPPTSGTRDAFVELAMEGVARPSTGSRPCANPTRAVTRRSATSCVRTGASSRPGRTTT